MEFYMFQLGMWKNGYFQERDGKDHDEDVQPRQPVTGAATMFLVLEAMEVDRSIYVSTLRARAALIRCHLARGQWSTALVLWRSPMPERCGLPPASLLKMMSFQSKVLNRQRVPLFFHLHILRQCLTRLP